jgi:hypothetical protein
MRTKVLDYSEDFKLILVCDDVNKWHEENFKKNKADYPLIPRYLSLKFVHFFQNKGAKIHFNSFEMEKDKKVQYGVVDYNDFVGDLSSWRHLTVSTYMQKPFEILIDEESNYLKYQEKNLKSAICYSCLLSLNENQKEIKLKEEEFFRRIVEIPYIISKAIYIILRLLYIN